MQVHNPQNEDFKCPSCIQNFLNIELLKQHYKSDFHRYNLKRKMVKLAPITEQQFKSKKSEARIEEKDNFKCNECSKKFNSAQTLNQHALSKKHDPNKNIIQEQSTKIQRVATPFVKNINVCLFCQDTKSNFEDNLTHMERVHGFFIPQLQFCKDRKGLIEYLQEKIEVGFLCITCENKGAKDFSAGEAVRKHMIDRGHTFMKTQQGYEEYQNFYDFSKQFEELLELQKDVNIPGISYTKVKVYVNEDNAGGDEDWEDEDQMGSNEDGSDEDDESWESIEGEEEQSDKKEKTKQIKTYKIMKPTLTPNDELLLPNGKVLGHRKYRFLYRQSYRNQDWLSNKLQAIGVHSQAVGNAIISREKMIEFAKHDRLMYKTKNRRDKIHLHNGMQNNLLMKYFRCQNSL